MRTCREMGMPTVAVYAEPDARAPHTYFADERVALAGPSPRQAYLDIDQLVRVARERGADAVHRGYGFLAENPSFAEACAKNGLTFIGPSASSMRAMGDKVEARRRMIEAGVPVVPGTTALRDEQAAVTEAARIGYPVLVKAAAGGGGIGMRVAPRAEELPAAFEACRRAAQASFASPDVYLERYLSHPRHIEMQVPAGGHAIEFRINAEDPLRNFMPTPRRIQRYAPPTGPGVRVDSGIRPHQEISPHFDSLLLKLIVWAEDRDAAVGRGRRALQEMVLTGPKTTVPFHRALLEEADFLKGRISTSFIQEHPGLLEKTKAFDAQGSPLESLYGGGEVAAAIAAAVID